MEHGNDGQAGARLRLGYRLAAAQEAARRRKAARQYVGDEVAVRPERPLRAARRSAGVEDRRLVVAVERSEEHTSELQSLMRISYAVFCLKKKKMQKDVQS